MLLLLTEIGHIYHNVMLQNNGMDWEKAGVRPMRQLICIVKVLHTYVSKQIVKGLNESVYYSYDDDGEQLVTILV